MPVHRAIHRAPVQRAGIDSQRLDGSLRRYCTSSGVDSSVRGRRTNIRNTASRKIVPARARAIMVRRPQRSESEPQYPVVMTDSTPITSVSDVACNIVSPISDNLFRWLLTKLATPFCTAGDRRHCLAQVSSSTLSSAVGNTVLVGWKWSRIDWFAWECRGGRAGGGRARSGKSPRGAGSVVPDRSAGILRQTS